MAVEVPDTRFARMWREIEKALEDALCLRHPCVRHPDAQLVVDQYNDLSCERCEREQLDAWDDAERHEMEQCARLELEQNIEELQS